MDIIERANLEQTAAILIADVQLIDAQLGQHRRYTPDGKELTIKEFEQWRYTAKVARARKMLEYRAIKARFKEDDIVRTHARAIVAPSEISKHTDHDLVLAAYDLLQRMIKVLDVGLTESDKQTMRQLKAYAKRYGCEGV